MSVRILIFCVFSVIAFSNLTTLVYASDDLEAEFAPLAFDLFTLPAEEESDLPGFSITPDAKRYWPLGEGESALTIKALKLALEGKHLDAQEIKSDLADPTARKLIDWLWVHARKGGPDRAFLEYFAKANPDWPRAHRLNGKIERSLLAAKADTLEVLNYFTDLTPKTSAGMIVYAQALLKDGKKEDAGQWIKKAYRTVSLPSSLAGEIAVEHSEFLSDGDRQARLDGLIVHHETTLAVRAASGMDEKFQKYAKAAHKLLTGAKDAPGALAAVPLKLRHQPGLQYARIRYQLRKNKNKAAAEIMIKASKSGLPLPHPERWWKIRRDLIRHAFEEKKPEYSKDTAYALASSHGLTEGRFYPDAEWMAGWLALSFLKKPEDAAKHFQTSARTAIRTYDKSRGHYWLGKVMGILGEADEARLQHQTAAGFGFTFYGLLSEAQTGSFLSGDVLPPSALPSRAQRLAVRQSELVKAVQMLAHEDARQTIKVFLKSMANTYKTPGEHGALMEIAEEIGGVYLAMKFTRYSEWRGIHVGTPAFPVEALPSVRPLTESQVEQPLILGVVRQESEFNREAVSHVGAKGLMQIMPATARWLCRIHKIKCSQKRLTSDPAFNVQLGSAFLYRLVREWRGSYIMAAAAYNAGGSRVQKWNARFGDPRKGEITPLEWIELIPFSETRNYVKRVMRNVQIYRRMLQPEAGITLADDIARGFKAKGKAAQIKAD